MIVDWMGLMDALSYALDEVENEVVGITKGHGKRVALFSTIAGRNLELSKEDLVDLAVLSILHDNALTQFVYEKSMDSTKKLGQHCIYGETNVFNFPLYSRHPNAILFHHENYNGKGMFLTAIENQSLFSQLIHFGDILDLQNFFLATNNKTYKELLLYLDKTKNVLYSGTIIEAFLKTVDEEMFHKIRNGNVDELLNEVVGSPMRDFSFSEIKYVVDLFAKIIDFKSEFTKNHSLGVARKAYEMGKFYSFPEEKCERLYVAGAFHDIGKMAIHNKILEKLDKLSTDEFSKMKNHAYYTYETLKPINGFSDICEWASYHHEKLNGKGYPFGKTDKDLSFEDRLMAVLDIFQALTESRPYKKGLSPLAASAIMDKMVHNYEIDKTIKEDVIARFSE